MIDERNEAAEEILKRYGRLMRKLAWEILRDWDEVEDVMQTALWEIISKHPEKAQLPPEQFRGYLCAAVKNTALNLYRQKRQDRERPTDPFVMREMTMDRVDLQTFEDRYGFSVEMGQLIESLDSVDRDIIRLKIGLGFSHSEVALAVGKSETAVRKRLERAVKKLQVILLEKEVAENDR